MTGKMNWRRARLHGRRTLDHRYENELPDRAQRWIEAVERRPRERRATVASSSATSPKRPNQRRGS